MYRIKLTEVSAQMLRTIETRARNQIISTIDKLKDEPNQMGKPLVGPLKDFRSIRAAGQRYRIIYQVQEEAILVVVVAVGLRKSGDKKDIYELMKKLVKTGILNKDD